METLTYNEDIKIEIAKSKEQDLITAELVDIFMSMATSTLNKRLNTKLPMEVYKDIAGACVLDCVKFYSMYNEEKSSNAYAYFTQIIRSTLAREYKKLIRKQTMAKKQESTLLEVVKNEVKESILNKPTPEEILAFKKDFDESLENFHATRWDLSEEKGAFASNDVGIFLLDFMKRFAFWTKTGWMGMIKMEEEIQAALKAVTDENPISLDYQGLEFCAYMLSNPGGVGLQLALDFEKIADKYAKVSMTVARQQEDARASLKDIAYKQEKYAAAEQGFYLAELEPVKEDEECEECDE